MSHLILTSKRGRGRPKKRISAVSHLPTFSASTQAQALKRRLENKGDIQVIDLNGSQMEIDESGGDALQPTRSQPHRRARFTENYDRVAEMVVISEPEESGSESESDSDCEILPSPPPPKRSASEQAVWEDTLKSLQKELVDEEMKLVLLTKLRDSQRCGESKRDTGSPSIAQVAQWQAKKAAQFSEKSIMLKGGVEIQPLPSKQLMTNKYVSGSASKKDVKPTLPIPSNNILPNATNLSQPLRLDVKNQSVKIEPTEQLNSNHLQQYPLLKSLSNQITVTPVPSTLSSNTAKKSSVAPPPPPVQSPAPPPQPTEEKLDEATIRQRQAAAKLTLRKQLEKTLLQIPLPKPPPLKISFFPNPNSAEFLCLMGLDTVVDRLLKLDRVKVKPRDPLRCAQCSTDFTCSWKWKEVSSNAYDAFCEACITYNVRKALKAQHTSNLKAAFLKALQQEKEIDRLANSLSSTAVKSSSSSSSGERHKLDILPPPTKPSHGHHSSKSISHSPAPLPSTKSSRLPHAVPSILAPPAAHQATNSLMPKLPAFPFIPPGLTLSQMTKLGPAGYQQLLQVQAQQLLAAQMSLHPLGPFVPAPNHTKSEHHRGRQPYHRTDGHIPSAHSRRQPHSSSWKA